jgi:hypothetical protein
MEGIKYYLPGIILILSGLLIIVFPEVLIALLASLTIMAGIGALIAGKSMHNSVKNFHNINGHEFHDESISDFGSIKGPFVRFRQRWF